MKRLFQPVPDQNRRAGVLPDGVCVDLSFDDDAASNRQTAVQLRREGNALQNKLTWNQVFTPNFNSFNQRRG